MKIQVTRGRSVVGAVVPAVVLGVASVAAACIPGQENTTNFVVTQASGRTGDLMQATGTDMERGNWPYTIKLFPGAYNSSTYDLRSRCGTTGIPQTVAKTSDGTLASHLDNRDPLYHTATEDGWAEHDFNVTFVLNAGAYAGPAHFCAIPGAERNSSSVVATIPYFDTTFTVNAITII